MLEEILTSRSGLLETLSTCPMRDNGSTNLWPLATFIKSSSLPFNTNLSPPFTADLASLGITKATSTLATLLQANRTGLDDLMSHANCRTSAPSERANLTGTASGLTTSIPTLASSSTASAKVLASSRTQPEMSSSMVSSATINRSALDGKRSPSTELTPTRTLIKRLAQLQIWKRNVRFQSCPSTLADPKHFFNLSSPK